MEYEFWRNEKGLSPVLQELEKVAAADANSGRSYWLHLDKVKKYTFEQLWKAQLIKKRKGKNPYKLFELRFALPKKIARTLFVIDRQSRAWLLHLVIKKKDDVSESDVKATEARAEILNKTINYK